MAFLLLKKKKDLIELAEELGLIVEAGLTKPKLKDLILKSPDYVEEDVKVMLDSILKDRISTEEKVEKLRREEREYELEKFRIQAERNTNTMNNSENVQAPKLIHETFHKFNMKDDIGLNLTLFERHAELTFLPKKDWVQKLIGLIPIDIAHLIAREPADKCNDYDHVEKLNRKLVKDRFPLPLIEDVLDKLREAKVYTTLDLKNGFFHVDVNEDCKHLTSFVVPDGQFEFNKVPFGLSTSSSVFQRYVYSIFRELMRKGVVIIYMDDLIIPAKDEKEGLEKLKEVLKVASKYGLEMKFKKCQFLRRKVEYLDHVVEKWDNMSFNCKNNSRQEVSAYSQIAKPLSDLTRKDNPFMFEQPQMEAFEKLKKLLTESPVLSIFQQGKTTELHTDASQGYGAVLLQEAEDGKLHPV
ncbi:hypothetical protein TNIN_431701 [Trichonephila inaurata madagascariensis]|uniref:Reverse transcriptase domain-containing protein n=1 Tax=Trichonephila inaurata madagascariensis TaxID=2747483 RepID=A0A8X7BUW3_9ARAC|nr:hypothetical protein TNIN_431701 [Trichonephila inaurata madagascariensis]